MRAYQNQWTSSLKQSLKIMSVALLMISCDAPGIKSVERCVVSIEHEACFCHQYEITKKRVGRITDTIDYPIEYCDKLVGFKPVEWGTVRMWIGDIFAFIARRKNKNDSI